MANNCPYDRDSLIAEKERIKLHIETFEAKIREMRGQLEQYAVWIAQLEAQNGKSKESDRQKH